MTLKVCLVSSLGEQHVIDSCRLAPAVLAQATVGNVSEVNSLLHHVLDVSANPPEGNATKLGKRVFFQYFSVPQSSRQASQSS